MSVSFYLPHPVAVSAFMICRGLLFIVRSRLLVYSAGSGVNSQPFDPVTPRPLNELTPATILSTICKSKHFSPLQVLYARTEKSEADQGLKYHHRLFPCIIRNPPFTAQICGEK